MTESGRGASKMTTSSSNNHQKPWSTKDKEWLNWYWGELAIQSIAERLGRSIPAVESQAKRQGLATGCPRGWIRACDLAKEVGFDRNALLNILNAVGVRISRGWKSRKKATGYPIVNHDRGLEAVTEWLRWESVYEAANKHGVSHTWLKKLLITAGLEPPPKGTRWRLPPEKIAAVVSAWRRAGGAPRPGRQLLSPVAARLQEHEARL